MPKTKITFPDKSHFETKIPVRIDDINYGKHLSNDKYLSIAFEARFQFYRHFGVDEMDLGGVSTIMTHANINYLIEAKYGDVLLVQMAIRDIRNASFEIVYKLVNTENDKVCALVETGIACFNYATNKIGRVPESFKEKFA